jgi:type VII secretion integral membrane protein EccD
MEVDVRQALAVPTQSGGGVRRVSIDAESARVDLVLSASTPTGLLIPPIVDILARSGDFRPGSRAVRYQLSLPGGAALDPSKTLSELRIRDGAIFRLTSSSNEVMDPRFDDEAEAVSAAVAATQGRWTPQRARLVGSLVTAWLACVAATALLHHAFDASGIDRAGCAEVAAAIALLSLVAASIAYRVYREPSIGMTWGGLASGFAGLTGLCAVPGALGAPNALLAAAASATSAAAMRVISSHAVAFTALLAVSATGAAASAVAAITAITPQAVGAAVAALSLALLEASAPMSLILARLSPSATNADSDTLPTKAIRARAWLTSLICAFSISAALGAICAALTPFLSGAPRFPGLLFASAIGGVMLLRARAHRDLSRSLSLIICGVVTFSVVLVATAAAYPRSAVQTAAASMMLGAAALCLALIRDTTTVSPMGRRSIELLEYLAFAVVVPLAVWLCGLYGAARGVNLP